MSESEANVHARVCVLNDLPTYGAMRGRSGPAQVTSGKLSITQTFPRQLLHADLRRYSREPFTDTAIAFTSRANVTTPAPHLLTQITSP